MFKKTGKKNGDIFGDLVTNAIDYMKFSINQIEKAPKYSLINFVTAVELFLKARLLKEHWTLLLENIDKGNISNFMQGELITIDFKTANNRLSNILQQPLSKKEYECFENLGKHRNKLIHFYNKAYSGKSKKAKSNVLYELLEGWFYLHRLLTEKWKDEFKNYIKDIDRINNKIIKNKNFWTGKYNALKDEIAQQKKKGIFFENCFVCSYPTSKLEEIHDNLYDGQCLVCNNKMRYLEVECPNTKCEETIFISEGGQSCPFCHTEVSIEYLKEKFEPYVPMKERMYGEYDIHCSECFFNVEPTVIEFNDKYLCLQCLELYEYEDLSQCESCYEKYAGDIGEDTSYLGCSLCSG